MVNHINFSFETESIISETEQLQLITHIPGMRKHQDEIVREVQKFDDGDINDSVLRHFIDFIIEKCL